MIVWKIFFIVYSIIISDDHIIKLGHFNLIYCFSGLTNPTFGEIFLLVLRSEVRFNYILSMHNIFFLENDLIIDLGYAQLIALFSFTSWRTDPILR